jgi:hypothetical protein
VAFMTRSNPFQQVRVDGGGDIHQKPGPLGGSRPRSARLRCLTLHAWRRKSHPPRTVFVSFEYPQRGARWNADLCQAGLAEWHALPAGREPPGGRVQP